MAGALKREVQDASEEFVLMRALRDMNMPKFIYEDVPLFMGLISDLFPGIEAKRKPYEKAKMITDIMEKQNLKPIKEMIDKVV